MNDVSKLVDKLGELGQQSKKLYQEYKEVEEQKAIIKAGLEAVLSQIGLKSAKTDQYTASIATKPTIQVTHELSVLEWLKETPDIETDQYIGLKKTEFKTLALTMLKNTGEVVPGTEVIETKSLSIRSNAKQEKKVRG